MQDTDSFILVDHSALFVEPKVLPASVFHIQIVFNSVTVQKDWVT